MNIHNFQIDLIQAVQDNLDPAWSWISDTNGWTGFHLWYIFQNSVKIQTEKEEYQLSEGDTFLFDLAQNHRCSHNPQKPASMFTAYFHCRQAAELQEMLRTGKLPRRGHPALFHTNMQLFEQAVRPFHSPAETELWLAPIFCQILSPQPDPSPSQNAIAEICRTMDTEPQRDFPLTELAAGCGYSPNQFLRLFRKETGTTPHAYLIAARIARARHLLLFSDYTATQIARMLGYSDLNHFSSQFYRKTGFCPSEYAAQFRDAARNVHK